MIYNPLITVIIISYNSSKYIKEAIDSFIAQEGFQDFKIVISDDCSTDGTQDIIKSYCIKYPNKIYANYNSKNLGIAGNLFRNIEKVKSKYITTSAADDIIKDKFYLRDSFKILENNENITMTYTNGYSFYENNLKSIAKINLPFPTEKNLLFDINYWLENGFFSTNVQGMLFRRSDLPNIFEKWMYSSEQEDWLLIFLLLHTKKLFHFQKNKLSTLYRMHSQNYTNLGSIIKKTKGSILLTKNLNKYTNYEYSKYLDNSCPAQHEKLSLEYIKTKNYLLFLKHMILFLISSATAYNKLLFFKTLIKNFLINLRFFK